jgi:hypothetical protein
MFIHARFGRVIGIVKRRAVVSNVARFGRVIGIVKRRAVVSNVALGLSEIKMRLR